MIRYYTRCRSTNFKSHDIFPARRLKWAEAALHTGRRHINNNIDNSHVCSSTRKGARLAPFICMPPPGMVFLVPKMPTSTAPTPSPMLRNFRLPGFGVLGDLPDRPAFPSMPGMMTFVGMAMPMCGVWLMMGGMRPPM